MSGDSPTRKLAVEGFDSYAADLQRVNIFAPYRGQEAFWNAGALLKGDFEQDLVSAKLLRGSEARRLSGALRVFLEAAEALADRFLIEAELDDKRRLTLRYREEESGPAVEKLKLKELASGKWGGSERVDPEQAKTLVQAAKDLNVAFSVTRKNLKLTIIIRTFVSS